MSKLRSWLAGLAGVLVLALAGPALAAPAMWAVRDEDSTIYLFGTMHILSEDAEWRTPLLDTAIRQATDVWFEMDVDLKSEDTLPLVIELGFDFEKPLPDKIGKKAWKRLKKTLKPEGAQAEMLKHMRPWMAATLLMVAPTAKTGQTAETGADMTLDRLAREQGKRRRFFETLEQQLHFFADLPEASQIALLVGLLEGDPVTEYVAIEGVWREGEDVEALGLQFVAGMKTGAPELYEVLIVRRNQAWVKTLTHEMQGSGVQIVNVGAFHMFGDEGLVALLRAQGFTGERVQ